MLIKNSHFDLRLFIPFREVLSMKVKWLNQVLTEEATGHERYRQIDVVNSPAVAVVLQTRTGGVVI